MDKFLFRTIPEPEKLLPDFGQYYPEVDSLSLYTHMWVRLMGTTLGDAVDNHLGRHGISSGRFLIMMILEFNKDGLKPSQIASHLDVTQATVTGLIDGLEKSGLAKRRADENDKRACFVALTEEGHQFISKVRPDFNRWIDRVYADWTPEEKNQLVGLIRKFCDGLWRTVEKT